MPGRLHFLRRASGVLAPLLAIALLTGCAAEGNPSGAASGASSATATALPTATATSLPTTSVASGACGKHFPYAAALTPANGLVVTQYSGLGNLAYPHVQIPSSQPAQPIPAPQVNSVPYYSANSTPVVNPSAREGGGGYALVICNPSSQPHTISAVQVSIATMTPFTDQLGAWEPCDGAYHPDSNNVGGGCGGADFENEYLHAAFAADAPVGASATATQTGANSSDASNGVNLGPLPVTLKPSQAMTIEVGVTHPSLPGYYTYSFALTVDGSSTGTVAYSLMTLFAPVARVWNGAACETSAMRALIAQEPTPTPYTGYICPAS